MYKNHNLRPFTAIGLKSRIDEHLRLAKAGDRERESKLVNRLGEVRATWEKFEDIPDFIQDSFMKSVTFLRTVGRKFNFGSPDPKDWISARGGGPRVF
jgi:hypothetical protein